MDGVDVVVDSGPRVARATLAATLIESEYTGEVWMVGDCYAPRTALEATYEGRLAGSAIGVDDLSYFSSTFQTFRGPLLRR